MEVVLKALETWGPAAATICLLGVICLRLIDVTQQRKRSGSNGPETPSCRYSERFEQHLADQFAEIRKEMERYAQRQEHLREVVGQLNQSMSFLYSGLRRVAAKLGARLEGGD